MKIRIRWAAIFAWGIVALLSSCASIPEKATPVRNFDIQKYLGKWYEIARFDFRFERDLDNTMARYSLDKNGNVTVLNSGYNFKKREWRSAEGIAKFRGDQTSAALKVSFFGPFYAGYNVVALDDEYQHALVAGRNLDYLWILSREKSLPLPVREQYLKIAREIGYDTSRLIWVKHDKTSPFEDAR